MKLLFILIFFIIQLHFSKAKNCYIQGYLNRYKILRFESNIGSEAYYLNMSDFDDIKGAKEPIKIKMKIYSGGLKEEIMYFSSSNDEIYHISHNLTIAVNYADKSDYVSRYDYYFEIPKTDLKFLYFSVPEFSINIIGAVEISIIAPSLPTTGVYEIIGIIVGIIAIIFIIILSIYLIKSIMDVKMSNKQIAQVETEEKNDSNDNIPQNEYNPTYIPP